MFSHSILLTSNSEQTEVKRNEYESSSINYFITFILVYVYIYIISKHGAYCYIWH